MGNDYTDKLNEKHSSIIQNLQELQAVETYLFSTIQEVRGRILLDRKDCFSVIVLVR